MNQSKGLLPILALLLLLTSCFNNDLKQIKLQTLSFHPLSFPESQDTSTVMEVRGGEWNTDWDSIRINAGIEASDIQEAVPIAVELLIETPDSTFADFDEISVYSETSDGRVLLAALSESSQKTQRQISLFTVDNSHLKAFTEEGSWFLFRYQSSTPIDTTWNLQMGVIWEMRGEW